jgi:hypothetical protein
MATKPTPTYVHTHYDEESVLGFGRVIWYMTKHLGGFGLWGPRFPF